MFTEQFFDLPLNLNGNWKVSNVKSDYNFEKIIIQIDYVANTENCPKNERKKQVVIL